MDNFFDNRAEESEDLDESVDEETGEVRRKTREGSVEGFDDSSDEDEEDDDAEAAAEVAKDFIVDEEDEDEETRRERRRQRKKRRREERERDEEGLDDEDLELIGLKPVEDSSEPKYKRLKRGPREEGDAAGGGVNDIFRESDDEDGADSRNRIRSDRRGVQDEFEDFIEEDVFSDDERRPPGEDDQDRRRGKGALGDLGLADTTGLDPQALEDFRQAFGDGTDYDFALEQEDVDEEQQRRKDKHLDLKDVFEPSQLEEKLLTDDDNVIRATDEPERHQLARRPYRHVELTDEELREEAGWVSKFMLQKKGLPSDLHEPFRKAVAQVIDFLVRDDFEVSFIFQNRKDYLIHAVHRTVGHNDDGTPRVEVDAKKLLHQSDLWDIFDWDLKFRALIEKRNTLQKTYDSLQKEKVPPDAMFEEMLPKAVTMEELQDLQDYVHFQYASRLKDISLTTNGETNGANGAVFSKKKAGSRSIFEQIRNGTVYGLVRAFGITADAFAQNVLRTGPRTYTEDPSEVPDVLADSFVDDEFMNSTKAVKAARAMFVEELATSPRLRRFLRENVYITGVIDCYRTEKGLRKIDDSHPYYEFKYLRNQAISEMLHSPALFLKMLKAEEEGLTEVKVKLSNHESLKRQLFKQIETDNVSTVADAWNAERRDAVSAALDKIMIIMEKLVKENVRTECEGQIAADIRDEFGRKLDQAPYNPNGMKKGTIPRVLALSNGAGYPGREAICWAYVSEEGRVHENGKYTDLAAGDSEKGTPDGDDVATFVDMIRRRQPDVIAVAGWSPETRKLRDQIENVVQRHNLRGAPYQDDDDQERADYLEVLIVNDDIARLYQSSDRAKVDHPGLPPLTLYCVELAKYMQDPLKEYAALGRDLVSISFHPDQNLLSQDKVIKQLEACLVEFVSMTGVDINESVSDVSVANLLQYVPGLGPRKATQMLKAINLDGGWVSSREALLGIDDTSHAAMGTKVWTNAASFLYLAYEAVERDSEYLDNTRIHPEDYDIARKMAADALELDEEDIAAEVGDHGAGAIVRKLIKEDAQDKVNDLVLEEYAEQLEKNLQQRKRATLENIRAEIIEPFEELRQPFVTKLARDDLFMMLTGETRYSLDKGMNVSVSVKKVFDHAIEGKLDCGLEVFVPEDQLTDRMDVPARSLFAPHQTYQAQIMSVDLDRFVATVSLLDDVIKKPYRRYDPSRRDYSEWDDRQEAADRKLLESKSETSFRAGRVIKHNLFRPFNAKQAEEYLGSQSRGDVVIRPSSKGMDHLAVTWKVADGIFQHIDVLELDKENEFSLGKTLRIGGKYTYSDLDELVDAHVNAMAKKVDEMISNEKFLDKTKAGVGMYIPTPSLVTTIPLYPPANNIPLSSDEWLTTYTAANPKRSMYMFCLNRERPGFFHLCFKAGQKARLTDWPVRVIPRGFELNGQPYGQVKDLCNGFKVMFSNAQSAGAVMAGRNPGPQGMMVGGAIGVGGGGGGGYGGGYGVRR